MDARDLDLQAALVDAGDPPLDRDAVLEGLLQLGPRRLAAGAGAPRADAEDQAAGVAVAAGHHRLEPVADGDGQVPLLVAQLVEGDQPLGLGAEVDEGGVLAEADDLALDPIAGLARGAAARRRRRGLLGLEAGEDVGEIFGHG